MAGSADLVQEAGRQPGRLAARWGARADGRGVARVGASNRCRAVPAPSPPPDNSDQAELGLWPAPLEWARLTPHDRAVYEVGFLMGFLMREEEVKQANADADRYYRIAFDRPQCRRCR